MKLHDNLEQVQEEAVIEEQAEIELTDAQIAKWKKEHGKIFKTVIDGETYIWRRLKRREYVEAMSYRSEENPDANIYIRQNIIAGLVTLYPADMAWRIEEYAGLAGEISDRAILKSGFDASETEEL